MSEEKKKPAAPKKEKVVKADAAAAPAAPAAEAKPAAKKDGKNAMQKHHEQWALVEAVLSGLRKEQYV